MERCTLSNTFRARFSQSLEEGSSINHLMTQNLSTLKIPITKQLAFVSNVLFAWASLLISLNTLKFTERSIIAQKYDPTLNGVFDLRNLFSFFFNLLSDPFSTLFSFQLVKSQIFQIWLTTCNPEMRSRPLMLLDIYNIYVTVKNMWRIKSGIAHSFAIFSVTELTIL